MLTRITSVTIPKLMRTLEKDHRGYPIPFIVLRDITNKPMFTANDTRKIEECLRKKLCSICGKKMTDGYWYVGGSRAFLHPDGVFIDPPLHLECAEYAIKVCPFLAARTFKSISNAILDSANIPDNMTFVEAEYSGASLPERFGLGLTIDYPIVHGLPGYRLCQVQSWSYIEWWKQGVQVDAPDTYIVSAT